MTYLLKNFKNVIKMLVIL